MQETVAGGLAPPGPGKPAGSPSSSKRGRGPKAGACGRQVEEQAFTSGPGRGRGLWGNSQKRLEKDEEPDMGSKEAL